jgi:uncharacterized damage-inducible protein DinB
MRITITIATAALLAVAARPAPAQEMRHAQPMQHAQHHRGVAAIRPLYQRLRDLYVRAAEAMPEEHYGWRPAADVRTFGQLLGHVANENYLFCASAVGVANPNAADFEKTTSKADLVSALKASWAYCDPAYQMDEMKSMEETSVFGTKGTRLWALIFNVTHDSEHYGNMVTYMRLKGLVPPSSQGGM